MLRDDHYPSLNVVKWHSSDLIGSLKSRLAITKMTRILPLVTRLSLQGGKKKKGGGGGGGHETNKYKCGHFVIQNAETNKYICGHFVKSKMLAEIAITHSSYRGRGEGVHYQT